MKDSMSLQKYTNRKQKKVAKMHSQKKKQPIASEKIFSLIKSCKDYVLLVIVVVVQSFRHVQLSAAPWTAAHQASLSITVSQSLLKLMSTESVMPSSHLTLCCPLLLLPSIFPSIRVFSNESALHIRWPKYWSFHISPSNEYSGLISFRIDWFDLLAILGTLKSFLQRT